MNTRLPQVLICDDDSTFHLAVKHSLKGRCDCRSAYNGDEALAILRGHPIDLLLLDIQMRTPDEGLRYLPRFRELDPDLAIVMSSALTDFATVRDTMRLGANDYVAKDFNPQDLHHTIDRMLERRHLLKTNEQRDFEVQASQRQHVFLGSSPAILKLRRDIEKIRPSSANVIITGETGTGKEVVARQLRRTLPDGKLAPFVAIDSATIQSGTAESILFGHEKGAFTGAERATKGIFEEANGGAVYFDEVGNMPLEIQAKLLRVIQEKEVARLGASKTIPLEFRVICATNKDLEKMCALGHFKDDLLQRLQVIPLHLPALRERAEDIPELVSHFAERHAPGRPIRFSPSALGTLSAYDWPGNIRELSNVVAYVVTMSEGEEIELADLPPKFRDRPAREPGDFYGKVAAFERDLLARAYAEAEGNVSQLALRLGMDRSHLYTKLREHGLHQKSLKSGNPTEKPNERE